LKCPLFNSLVFMARPAGWRVGAWNVNLFALFCLSTAIRLETAVDSADNLVDFEDQGPSEPLESVGDFMEHVYGGLAVEEELTCEQLPGMMVSALTTADETLAGLCQGATSTAGMCDNETYVGEDNPGEVLTAVQGIVAGLMSEAEKRYCLVSVMTDSNVDLAVRKVLRFVPSMMRSGSEVANKCLEEGYRRLLAWQMAMVDQAEHMSDRTTLLPTAIEDPAHCPAPCQKCTRRRNRFRKDEMFSFQCTLRRGDPAPARPGLTCGKVRRRLFGWRKTWCEVEDWKAAACQQVRVAALVNCGAESIMSAVLRNESSRFYSSCMTRKQANHSIPSVPDKQWDISWYESSYDYMVEPWLSLGFSTIVTVGMGSGLAAMREAARGQFLPGLALVEEGEANTPQQILSAYKLGEEIEIDGELRELYSSSNNTVQCEKVARLLEGCKDFFRTISWFHLLDSFFRATAIVSIFTVPVALSSYLFLYLLSAVKFAVSGTGLAMGKIGAVLGTLTSIATMATARHYMFHFKPVHVWAVGAGVLCTPYDKPWWRGY